MATTKTITQDSVIQRARYSDSGSGSIGTVVIKWETPFADDNYTVQLALECQSAAGTTNAVLYSFFKLADHSGIQVTLNVVGGLSYVLHAVAIRDKD